MKNLFIGNLSSVDCFPKYDCYLNIIEINKNGNLIYRVLKDSSPNSYSFFNNFSNSELHDIYIALREIPNNCQGEQKDKIDNIIVKMFNPCIDNIEGKTIIYEKKYGSNKNTYGKELITKVVFPIGTINSQFDIDYIAKRHDIVFYDIENDIGYVVNQMWNNDEMNFEYFLEDFDGNRFKIDRSIYVQLIKMNDTGTKKLIINNKMFILSLCKNTLSLRIRLMPMIVFNNQRLDFVVLNERVANDIEIKEYINKYNKSDEKRKLKKNYKDIINNY